MGVTDKQVEHRLGKIALRLKLGLKALVDVPLLRIFPQESFDIGIDMGRPYFVHLKQRDVIIHHSIPFNGRPCK